MKGKVIDFRDGHWRVQTEEGIIFLEDWQCRTGMAPDKEVTLLFNSGTGYWYAEGSSGEG